MNPTDFCYWLQGYFEVSGQSSLSNEQTEIVKNHLNLVFEHSIDPQRGSETTASTETLNQAHSGSPNPSTLLRC